MIHLRLLGGFDARRANGAPVRLPTRKAAALLALLGLRPGEAHSRDRLAALLWGDMPDAQARGNLRNALATLRRALGDPASVVVADDTVAVETALVASDVDAIERAVAAGTPEALERVAELDRGELLEGFRLREAAFEEWLDAERERVRLVTHGALERLLAHRMADGALDAATMVARRLLGLDPVHEGAHRVLMRAYAAQGQRAAAIRQFGTCAARLRKDLGIEPDGETRALYETIRQAATPPAAPTARGSRRADARATPSRVPLIGRSEEWTRLHGAVADAWKGRGRVVAVVGEAGIGKSRLADEVGAEVRRRGGQVLTGRCFETDLRLPFGPWLDAVRVGGALAAAGALEPAWRVQLARLFPELGGGEGRDGDRADVRQLLEALAQLVRRLAARRPLLLVLEDLHWADELSLRFLGLLSRRLPSWRVIVVATARSDELVDAPLLRDVLRTLERDEALVTLRLAPLSPASIAALVRATAGTDAGDLAALTEKVWMGSEGHPFMAVELLRAHRQGLLPATEGVLPLPERVRALVAARLERVGERERHVAAVAAVIGRNFSLDLLAAAAGLAEADVAAGVDELTQRRILRTAAGDVDFVHDHVRAVAYDLVSPVRRRLLHRTVAATLEGFVPREPHRHLAELGRHYREGEVWDRAAAYLRQAGALAIARSAYRDAAHCFEQALAANARLPRDRDRIAEGVDLRLDLRAALTPLREQDRALALVREAETLAGEIGDGLRLAHARACQAHHLWDLARYEEAVAAGRRALALAIEHGSLPFEVHARIDLARVFQVLAEYRALIDVLDPVVATLVGERVHERFEMPILATVVCHTHLAWAFLETGEIARALATADRAMRVATEAGHAYSIMSSTTLLGMLHVERGAATDGLPLLERALQLCVEGEYRSYVALASASLGRACLATGRAADALPLLRRAADVTRAQGPLPWSNIFDVWLAEGELAVGRPTEARERAAAAVERARERHELRPLVEGTIVLGDIAHAAGAVGEAQRHYRDALDTATKHGARLFEGRCRLKLEGAPRDRAPARRRG